VSTGKTVGDPQYVYRNIGGEAALITGFPVIDLPAVEDLYGAFALEVFPEAP
jgi:hypothetical protein